MFRIHKIMRSEESKSKIALKKLHIDPMTVKKIKKFFHSRFYCLWISLAATLNHIEAKNAIQIQLRPGMIIGLKRQ